ncbi:MAG: hypothetical protein K6E50_09840 [Lachnospiraceae bacterium]|nr:hypothetical protein [Lachnospiraceae bacterium]
MLLGKKKAKENGIPLNTGKKNVSIVPTAPQASDADTVRALESTLDFLKDPKRPENKAVNQGSNDENKSALEKARASRFAPPVRNKEAAAAEGADAKADANGKPEAAKPEAAKPEAPKQEGPKPALPGVGSPIPADEKMPTSPIEMQNPLLGKAPAAPEEQAEQKKTIPAPAPVPDQQAQKQAIPAPAPVPPRQEQKQAAVAPAPAAPQVPKKASDTAAQQTAKQPEAAQGNAPVVAPAIQPPDEILHPKSNGKEKQENPKEGMAPPTVTAPLPKIPETSMTRPPFGRRMDYRTAVVKGDSDANKDEKTEESKGKQAAANDQASQNGGPRPIPVPKPLGTAAAGTPDKAATDGPVPALQAEGPKPALPTDGPKPAIPTDGPKPAIPTDGPKPALPADQAKTVVPAAPAVPGKPAKPAGSAGGSDMPSAEPIPNPLPTPKKHVAKEMDFDREIALADMHFDVVDMSGIDYYDIF